MTYSRKIGNNPSVATTFTQNYTFINLNSSASETCTINELRIYGSGSSTTKIKIFRDDGTNYNFISEVSHSINDGINYIEVDIDIQSGDLIGYYTPANGGSIGYSSTGGSSARRIGDITSNTLKTSWDSGTRLFSLGGGYGEQWYVKTTGNDTNSGITWTQAWSTVNKAATTVTDGSTVHIGFGTYNAEPAGNKIAPQNAGSSGIKYLCETATTGGGTGSVIVEKN